MDSALGMDFLLNTVSESECRFIRIKFNELYRTWGCGNGRRLPIFQRIIRARYPGSGLLRPGYKHGSMMGNPVQRHEMYTVLYIIRRQWLSSAEIGVGWCDIWQWLPGMEGGEQTSGRCRGRLGPEHRQEQEGEERRKKDEEAEERGAGRGGWLCLGHPADHGCEVKVVGGGGPEEGPQLSVILQSYPVFPANTSSPSVNAEWYQRKS